MKRRHFILWLAAAPLGAAAQSHPTVGFLRITSAAESKFLIEALRKGLAEGGYTEKKNLAIEYRFAEGQYERLPALAAGGWTGAREAAAAASPSKKPAPYPNAIGRGGQSG